MAMDTVITVIMAITALISPIHSRLVAAPMNFWRDACQMKAALAKCTTLVVQYHLLHHSDQLINHLISHLINHHSDQLISHLINHHSNQLLNQLINHHSNHLINHHSNQLINQLVNQLISHRIATSNSYKHQHSYFFLSDTDPKTIINHIFFCLYHFLRCLTVIGRTSLNIILLDSNVNINLS